MRILQKITWAAGFLTSLIALAIFAGVRVNVTDSYPVGIYLMTNAPIEKGALVIFCPTDNAAFRLAKERGYIGAGLCPDGYGYMIKKIMAVKNDKVEMSAIGVSVNGALLPNSKPLAEDSEGQPLSHIEARIATLDEDSILLMSDYNSNSFDARYFGIVNKSNVISEIHPFLTWQLNKK